MRATNVKTLVAAGILLLVPSFAGAVLDPAAKCQATKLKLAGKYAACRLVAEATAVKAGTTPDYTKCETKIAEGWAKVEAAYPEDCPTLGDLGEVDDSLVECLPTSVYTVRIFMDPTDPVAALQYVVNYAESYGELEGGSSSVTCVNLLPGVFAAFNDRDGDREMDAGFTGSTLWSSTQEIARCKFIHHGIVDARPAEFSLGVEIAQDQNGNVVEVPDLDVVLEKGWN